MTEIVPNEVHHVRRIFPVMDREIWIEPDLGGVLP
jgi:hypothetical protein